MKSSLLFFTSFWLLAPSLAIVILSLINVIKEEAGDKE